MSDLAAIILDILLSVTRPMQAGSLARVLFVTGAVVGDREPASVKQIDLALEQLVSAGRVERVRRRGDYQYQATAVVTAPENKKEEVMG